MGDRRGGTLLLFTPGRLQEMLDKGNLGYVRHYEAYFDRVCVAYLFGGKPASHVLGDTKFVSLGSDTPSLDLVLAPLRLLRLAQAERPDSYLTADQVFGGWTSLLLRRVLKARVRLLPVCQPEVIYRATGRAVSFLPIPIERFFTRWSFRVAHRIVTTPAFGGFVGWLRTHPGARGKLVEVDALAEALPAPGFLHGLESAGAGPRKASAKRPNPATLVYVGRLHREKLVDDLIRMMGFLVGQAKVSVRLTLIGDGPERGRLEAIARDLGVRDAITFVGFVGNEELPGYLAQSDVFVSPLTGTALREAALCGLPVIAYDLDWISGLLRHERHALLVPAGDFEEMGRQVVRLLGDPQLYESLSSEVHGLARRLWTGEGGADGLAMAFADH